MSFQPEKGGPMLLASIHRILAENGMRPARIVVCYDGQEDETSYSMAHHLVPVADDDGHAFLLATALRSVTDGMDFPEANGIFIRFFDDGTVIHGPAHFGPNGQTEEGE